jgi:hypothetical protein
LAGTADVGPTLVVAFTFIAVGGLLISLMGDGGVFSAQDSGFQDYAQGHEVIGGVEYTMFENRTDTFDGYDVTDANVDDWVDPSHNFPLKLSFHLPTYTTVHCEVIRDNFNYIGLPGDSTSNYKDFIFIWRHSGWISRSSAIIPYSEIYSAFDNTTKANNATVSFTAHLDYIAIFTTPHADVNGTTTYQVFKQDILNNTYNLQLGVNPESEHGSGSVWGWIGRMLTLQLPDMPIVLSTIIATPFWVAIGMVVYSLIKSWWPW